MNWKATVDRDDFTSEPADLDHPLVISRASATAYQHATLHPDIRAEHAKLDRADAVVLQFPLWWYGPPAILKGWIDRVFVKGYGYGVRDPEHPGQTLRYGTGRLVGKRALVITSTGSPAPALGPRGINGQLEEILFPLLHGTLWYVGMAVLPPVAIYGADRMNPALYIEAAERVRAQAAALEHTRPLAYRTQHGGDYDDDLVLRPNLEPGHHGLQIHLRSGTTPTSPDAPSGWSSGRAAEWHQT